MSGEQLKQKIKETGYSMLRISQLLGYENRQRFYSLMRYKNVKSGTIEDVARVTGRPVSWFYGEEVAQPNMPKVCAMKNKAGEEEDMLVWRQSVETKLASLLKETDRLSKQVEKMKSKE